MNATLKTTLTLRGVEIGVTCDYSYEVVSERQPHGETTYEVEGIEPEQPITLQPVYQSVLESNACPATDYEAMALARQIEDDLDSTPIFELIPLTEFENDVLLTT